MRNEVQTQETPFKRWYERNREKFNAKRRKRYQKDPAYRNKVLGAVRKKRKEDRANRPKKEGWTVTQAAMRLNRTAQTIRRWESLGYIPESFDERGIRRYTNQQIAMMQRLAKAVKMHKHHHISKTQLNALVKEIKGNWS